MRLIEAEKLKVSLHKAIEDSIKHGNNFSDAFINDSQEWSAEIWTVEDKIDNMPAIEAEPVRHGKWIDDGYYANYTNMKAFHCSECTWHMIGYEDELFRYCPTCGAKMESQE